MLNSNESQVATCIFEDANDIDVNSATNQKTD